MPRGRKARPSLDENMGASDVDLDDEGELPPLPPLDDEPADEPEPSALDAEPVVEAPKPKRSRSVKVRPTKKGSVQVEIPTEGFEPTNGNGRGKKDEEPVEPVSVTEIDGARPSLPKEVGGTLDVRREHTNYPACEDGVTPAVTGHCGRIPDDLSYKEEILSRWGGGDYVVSGVDAKGKAHAVRVKIAGYSKPIPGTPAPKRDPYTGRLVPPEGLTNGKAEDDEDEVTSRFGGYGPFGGPGGYTPGGPGYMQGSPGYTPGLYGYPYPGMGLGYPSGTYGTNDEEKEALKEKLAAIERQTELDKVKKDYESKLDRLVDEIREMKQAKPAGPTASDEFFRLQELKLKQDELKWAQEKEAREEARKQEAADRAAAAASAEKTALAQIEASKEIARIQASASEKAAASQVESMKQLVAVQTSASDKLLQVALTKSEDSGFDKILDRYVKIKELTGGGDGGEKSEAEKILTLLPAAADAVLPRIGEAIAAARGYLGGGAQGGDVGVEQDPDGEKLINVLDVGVKIFKNNGSPVDAVRAMAAACMGMDYPFEKVTDAILQADMAPPALFAQKMDQIAAGRSEVIVGKIHALKELVLSPKGKGWLGLVARMLKAPPAPSQAPAHPVSAAPPPPQVTTTAPAQPAQLPPVKP